MVSSKTTAVGSVLLAMLTGSLVPSRTEAWTTAQPHLMRIVSAGSSSSSSSSSSPASPLTGVPSLSTRAVTRWDEHLNLAKREHHRKNWGQVRQLCTGVISIADDWTAVEQAHLRLALAEQKDQRVDAARRAFQATPLKKCRFVVHSQTPPPSHNRNRIHIVVARPGGQRALASRKLGCSYNPETKMSGRLLVIVTGASRGFGRCVAEEFARKVAPLNPVDLILIARSADGLRSAADSIGEIVKSIPDAADVEVRQEALDLGDMEHLEVSLDTFFGGLDPDRYSRAVLVNNAGSLGHISFVDELPSLAKLKSEMDFNVTSALWLSSRFTSLFGACGPPEGRTLPRNEPLATTLSAEDVPGSGAVTGDTTCASSNLVVNISSLAALKPFGSWGGYSAGKAARDMFHRVLAMEQASVGGLKVLNYAPGPMLTDMLREAQTPEGLEDGLRTGGILDPKVSAEKCVRLALGGTFPTGAHVDFYDEEEAP